MPTRSELPVALRGFSPVPLAEVGSSGGRNHKPQPVTCAKVEAAPSESVPA